MTGADTRLCQPAPALGPPQPGKAERLLAFLAGKPPPQTDSVPETARGLPGPGLTALSQRPHDNERESHELLSKQDYSWDQQCISGNYTSQEQPRPNRQNLTRAPLKTDPTHCKTAFTSPTISHPQRTHEPMKFGGTSRTFYLYQTEHATPNDSR